VGVGDGRLGDLRPGPAGVHPAVGELEAHPAEPGDGVVDAAVAPVPQADGLLHGHVVDHRVEAVVAQVAGELQAHVGQLLRDGEGRDVAPRSAGSLTAAVKAAGSAARMASKIVSMPGARRVMAVGQAAGELVVTTSPESRSHQALWRMRWWPGRAPVMSDV